MSHQVDELLARLEKLLRSKVNPIFKRYNRDANTLLAPLKWKPLVLVIGNYSSGKSTFINELLGRQVQRVGQAPTDDSFTIITRPEGNTGERVLPGSAVIADERLPFGVMRKFGEKLAAHLWLKHVDSPVLDDIAIIDTPGMLDSVTEKDRGYDYLGVVGELARLSDVIILMFDPHKAGTIKETYQAIRSTLPGSTGEDRVFYVMNRIDECENTSDFLKSYGALCWNLSQMTGRKDMPRVYLTYAPGFGARPEFAEWQGERDELKQAVVNAPLLRVDHVFEEVDRGIKEMAMHLEACHVFHHRFMQTVNRISQVGALVVLAAFLGGDVLLNRLFGWPHQTLIQALMAKEATLQHLVIPLVGAVAVLAGMRLIFNRLVLPWKTRRALANPDNLIELDTPYRRDLWQRVRPLVEETIRANPKRAAWSSHKRPLRKLRRFLERDLARLRERFKTTVRPAAVKPAPPVANAGEAQDEATPATAAAVAGTLAAAQTAAADPPAAAHEAAAGGTEAETATAAAGEDDTPTATEEAKQPATADA